MAVSREPWRIARELLEGGDYPAAEAALEFAGSVTGEARELLPKEWIERAAEDPDPRRRALAALAIGAVGGEGTAGTLHRLLQDPDDGVVVAACRAAGRLRDRAYLPGMIEHLSNPRVRPGGHRIDGRSGSSDLRGLVGLAGG